MLLSKFANEVLAQGAEAVLPQNLSNDWLQTLQSLADDFFNNQFEAGNCPSSGEAADPILLSCVSEILAHQHNGDHDVTEQQLVQKITLYALALTMETIRRESGTRVAPPSIDDIFSMARIELIKQHYPDLAQWLDQVCIFEQDTAKAGQPS